MSSESQPSVRPRGPLEGIQILDFCSAVAGAYSAMLLGDLGAEVIKIEPLEGDQARQWGPFFAGEGKLFLAWNRNKKSLAVDLKSDRGREIIHRLAARADVAIENFRPGIAVKLRIDAETLRGLNRRLIHCSVTAFGPRGPLRDRPAYDPILQAMSGAAAANLTYTGNVGICSVAIADYGTALLVFGAVCAALYRRTSTGEGEKIETSLLQGAMAMQSHNFLQPVRTPPEGAGGIYPNRLFKTRDSHIQISAPTNKFWGALCEAIGAPELIADPRCTSNETRCAHMETLTRDIEGRLASRSAQEWEQILLERGIPCAAVWRHDQFFASSQVSAMEMNPAVDHPTIGPIRSIGIPLEFESSPGAIQRASPRLGEHTDEILRSAGFIDEEIDQLRRSGTIRR